MSMLNAEIIGRVGTQAKWIENQGRDGKTTRWLQFSVAHNYQNQGNIEETCWVACFWRGSSPRLAELLIPGTEVYVRGRLSSRLYTASGNPQISLSISATELKILHKPGASTSEKELVPDENNMDENQKDLSGYYKDFKHD